MNSLIISLFQYTQNIAQFHFDNDMTQTAEQIEVLLQGFWHSSHGDNVLRSIISSFESTNHNMDYFTQLAWADTHSIGEFSLQF